jgi:hypothetical protein
MSNGQGSVTFSEPPGGGGGGGFPATGADNGLTIEGTDVVLGNAATDVTDPAALLNNRRIQMGENTFEWGFGTPGWFMMFNDESEGAGPNNIPIGLYSPAESYWQAFTPENFGVTYSPGGTANRWRSGYDVASGVNPDSPRPNVIGMWWGYNTSYQQGRIDATEAAFRYATETFFEIDGDFNFEFHTPEITTDSGDIFRLDSTYVSRATGLGFRELVINDFSWYDTTHNPDTGLFYADISYTVSSDLSRFILRSQNTGGQSEIIFGNVIDGQASLSFAGGLTFFDAPGQLELNAPELAFVATVNIGSFCNGFAISDIIISAADITAVLDVTSNSRGLFVPRLTTAQRLAINFTFSLTGGLLVYDTDIQKLYVSVGNAPTITWQQIQSL